MSAARASGDLLPSIPDPSSRAGVCRGHRSFLALWFHLTLGKVMVSGKLGCRAKDHTREKQFRLRREKGAQLHASTHSLFHAPLKAETPSG